jgi:ABC-type sugar transport system substrate-binding protein
MMRKPLVAGATLLLCLGMACKRGADENSARRQGAAGSQPAAASRGVVGISVLTLTNPFFKEIADSFRDEAARQGYETLVVSGELDVARQQNQVKDFIVRKVAAIVLTPCDSKSIGPVIQEANRAGIPVSPPTSPAWTRKPKS